MIPKIIHYCWFGKGKKSRKIIQCIDSWRTMLPDYEIIEWNEDNFNVFELEYTKSAYYKKKYAFVSDVARVKALYEYGGIYLDTDVVVYKKFDEILKYKCVLGFEMENYVATSFMACEPRHKLMKNFYEIYEHISFLDKEGGIIPGTNVSKLTNMLLDKGLKRNNCFQKIEDIVIYPQEYFSPFDYGNCIKHNTKNTICEHLFLVSWLSYKVKCIRLIKMIMVKIFGVRGIELLRRFK